MESKETKTFKLEELKLMAHAYNKHESRNFFGTSKYGDDDNIWKVLVKKGLAIQYEAPCFVHNENVYGVSEQGKKLIDRIRQL